VKRFLVDLHIHTALSPCASEEMTPPAIVWAAVRKGLGMIAICDHNTARNAGATQEAAGANLTVLAGMEMTTAEEVHVVGIFPDAERACAAGDEVRSSLPDMGDASTRFGEQRLMDAQGKILGKETKMLAASSAFGLSETVNLIKRHDGLAIAAHVDRPSFSVLSQLGMFPADAGFDAVEVSAAAVSSARAVQFSSFGLPVIVSSDSHFLSDVGTRCTVSEMGEPSFNELALAFKGIGQRRLYYA